MMILIVAGCSGASRNTTGGGRLDTVASITTSNAEGGLVLQRSDLDGDGAPDVFAYYRIEGNDDGEETKVLVRKSLDLSGNGKLDVTRHYEDGQMVREEVDLDFDGTIDAMRLYEDGNLKSEQSSSLFDGRFDVRKYYEDGMLVLKQVDTRRSGTFDEFQYFTGDKLSRIGWDHDGDGKPEVFEDNPAME